MNVMIIKVSGRKAIALSDNGEFITIPAKKGMQAGVSFELALPAKPPFSRALISAAAVFLAVLFGGFVWSIFSITSYVDININPGVRMAVNSFGGIVSLEGINEDGKALAGRMGAPFLGSAGNELKKIIEEAYIDNTLSSSGKMLITISDDNTSRAEKTEKELLQISFDAVNKKRLSVAIATQKLSMSAFDRLRAEQVNLNDAEKRRVYDSNRWHAASDKLYITALEVFGKDQMKITFSKAVSNTSGVNVTLSGNNGDTFPVQITGMEPYSWVLHSNGLTEKGIYSIAVFGLSENGVLRASFLYAEVNLGIQDLPQKGTDSGNKHNDKNPVPSASPPGSAETERSEESKGVNKDKGSSGKNNKDHDNNKNSTSDEQGDKNKNIGENDDKDGNSDDAGHNNGNGDDKDNENNDDTGDKKEINGNDTDAAISDDIFSASASEKLKWVLL